MSPESDGKVYRLLILRSTTNEILDIVEELVNTHKNSHAIVYKEDHVHKIMYVNRDSSPYPLSSTLVVLPITHKLNISLELISKLPDATKEFIDSVDGELVLVHMIKRVSNQMITDTLLNHLDGRQELLLNYYRVEGVDNS